MGACLDGTGLYSSTLSPSQAVAAKKRGTFVSAIRWRSLAQKENGACRPLPSRQPFGRKTKARVVALLRPAPRLRFRPLTA